MNETEIFIGTSTLDGVLAEWKASNPNSHIETVSCDGTIVRILYINN